MMFSIIIDYSDMFLVCVSEDMKRYLEPLTLFTEGEALAASVLSGSDVVM